MILTKCPACSREREKEDDIKMYLCECGEVVECTKKN